MYNKRMNSSDIMRTGSNSTDFCTYFENSENDKNLKIKNVEIFENAGEIAPIERNMKINSTHHFEGRLKVNS